MRYESQNRASNSLKGVSSATVSQMINGNWELIKDEMWRNVATQINYKDSNWIAVETTNYKRLMMIMDDVKANSLVVGITGNAGGGKTFALKHYTEGHKQTYLLCCNEYWNRKAFLTELMFQMGMDASGCTIGEMMSSVIRKLKMQESPLLILDEADKLADNVLLFFITLYNHLEDECGIVLCATDHLRKRIEKGVNLNKKGYAEIWSRLGRKCVELDGISASDITAICEANGVANPRDIDRVIAECDCDLRRVKRLVHAIVAKRQLNND